MHASLAASSVVGVLCAVAPSWPLLLGLRVLQGVTLAGLSAVAMAYLREEVHPRRTVARAALQSGVRRSVAWPGGCSPAASATSPAGAGPSRAAVAVLGVACTVVVRLLLLPASQGFVPRRRRAGAALWDNTRHVLGDRALLLLYALGGSRDGRVRRDVQRARVPVGGGAVRAVAGAGRARLPLLRAGVGELDTGRAGSGPVRAAGRRAGRRPRGGRGAGADPGRAAVARRRRGSRSRRSGSSPLTASRAAGCRRGRTSVGAGPGRRRRSTSSPTTWARPSSARSPGWPGRAVGGPGRHVVGGLFLALLVSLACGGCRACSSPRWGCGRRGGALRRPSAPRSIIRGKAPIRGNPDG